MSVLKHWRTYPTEIAHDLSAVHRRKIREWHRGEMSSRELIELVEFLDDESAFKTALRGGDWSPARIIQVRIANETMAARYDGTGAKPRWIKTPADEVAERQRDERRRAAYHQAQAELTGQTRTRKVVS